MYIIIEFCRGYEKCKACNYYYNGICGSLEYCFYKGKMLKLPVKLEDEEKQITG